jgi:hypothetical protein
MTKTFFATLTLGLFVTVGCGGEDSEGGSDSLVCADPNTVIVASTPAEAAKLCVGWSVAKLSTDVASCVAGLVAAGTMPESMAQIECTTSMTEAQCSDWEHQFIGSSGAKHGFWFARKVDGTLVLSGFGIWGQAQEQFCPTDTQPARPYCDGNSESSTVYFSGGC